MAPKGKTKHKFITIFKIMVVKTKFTVAKYDKRPLISSPVLKIKHGKNMVYNSFRASDYAKNVIMVITFF